MGELQLVKSCLSNDSQAQYLLFQRYAGKLMTICRRYANSHADAEDMLQEAFIRIFSNLHQFNFHGSLEGWMRRITVNTALGALRQNVYFADLDAPGSDNGHDPEILDHLHQEDLLKLIKHLPEGYRLVFNLFVFDGYSHQEIAAQLGIQESTSRSQLTKARRMLQNQLAHYQHVPHD